MKNCKKPPQNEKDDKNTSGKQNQAADTHKQARFIRKFYLFNDNTLPRIFNGKIRFSTENSKKKIVERKNFRSEKHAIIITDSLSL